MRVCLFTLSSHSRIEMQRCCDLLRSVREERGQEIRGSAIHQLNPTPATPA
jgi:hypothetical protein